MEPGTSNVFSTEVKKTSGNAVIILKTGTYENSSSFNQGRNLTIKAAEGAHPIVQLNGYWGVEKDLEVIGVEFQMTSSASEAFRLKTGASEVTFSDCNFINSSNNSVIFYAYSASTSAPLTINNCFFIGGKQSIYLKSGNNWGSCTVTNTTFMNGDGSTYRTIQGVNSTPISIDRCTFYNSSERSDYDIDVNNATGNITISNTVFANSHAVRGNNNSISYSYCVANNTSFSNPSSPSGVTKADPKLTYDSNTHTIIVADDSPILTAGADGTPIGDPRWIPTPPTPVGEVTAHWRLAGEDDIPQLPGKEGENQNGITLTPTDVPQASSNLLGKGWSQRSYEMYYAGEHMQQPTISTSDALQITSVTLSFATDNLDASLYIAFYTADPNAGGTALGDPVLVTDWSRNLATEQACTVSNVPAGAHFARIYDTSANGWKHYLYDIQVTASGGSPTPVQHRTITLDPNGGSFTSTPDGWTSSSEGKLTAEVYENADLTLPERSIASRDGYTVVTDGWFDGTDGGNSYTTVSYSSSVSTLYAKWTKNPISLPGTLLPADASLSANAKIDDNGGIRFTDNVADQEWATWDVSFAQAGTYTVSTNIICDNGHNMHVGVYNGDQLVGNEVNEGGQVDGTGEKTLGKITVPTAGNYTVKFTNSIQWTHLSLLSITFSPLYSVTYAAGDHGSGTMTDSNSPYNAGSDVTILTNGFTAATGYEFDGYKDQDGTTRTAGSQITAIAKNYTLTAQWKLKKYTIKFYNYDNSELQSIEVEHGATPEYTGSTPTKPQDAQYTYIHNGWTPTIVAATQDATYTATFSSTTRQYGISAAIKSGEEDYGSINPTSFPTTPVDYGTAITIDNTNRTITIGGQTITATAKDATAEYTYAFNGWTVSPEGSTITAATTATASFTCTKNQYTINALSLSNCSVTGTAWPTGKKDYGSSFSTTITANSGYALPENITISGATYTWDSSTGEFSITSVTGDVSVTITAVKVQIDPTVDWTGVPTTVYPGGKYAFTVETNSDATLSADQLTATGTATLDKSLSDKTITVNFTMAADASAAPTFTWAIPEGTTTSALNAVKNDITLGSCSGGGGEEEKVIYEYTFTGTAAVNEASATGGTMTHTAFSTDDDAARYKINNENYYSHKGVIGNSRYIKPTLNSNLQAGDQIVLIDAVYTANSSTFALYSSTSADGIIYAYPNIATKDVSTTQAYTIKSTDAICGQPTFYVGCVGNAGRIRTVKVIRSSGSGGADQTPNLAWDNLSEATVNKITTDADFTYTASSTNCAGSVSYASSETSVATVNSTTGEVEIKGAGTTTITATIAEGDYGCFTEKSITYTLNVSATYSITFNQNLPTPASGQELEFNEGTFPENATGISGSYMMPSAPANLKVKDFNNSNVYTFAGWKDGAGNIYTAGQSYPISSDLTLSAQWTPIQFNLKYYDEDGTTPLTGFSDAKYTYEDALCATSTFFATSPTKSGCTFSKWQRKSGDTWKDLNSCENATGFYGEFSAKAVWTIPVTGVSLNKNATSIAVGSSETLTATITPDNATNKNVTWSSSNDKVTVINGVVSVASDATVGSTATITVTTQDGEFTASCTITVTAAPVTAFVEWGYLGIGTAGTDNFITKNAFPHQGTSTIDRFILTTDAETDGWYHTIATDLVTSGTFAYLAAHNSNLSIRGDAPLDMSLKEVTVAWTNFNNEGGLQIAFYKTDGTQVGETQAVPGNTDSELQKRTAFTAPQGADYFILTKTTSGDSWNTNISYIKVEATQTSPLYTITYNAGDAQGEMASVQAAANRKFNLPKPQGFFYESHRFIGWKYSEDDENTYNIGDIITMPAKSISFTALWEEVDFAKSIDFASLAATAPDIATTLAGSNYVMSSLESVSWDNQGYGADDTGLKTEYGDREFSFWVQAYKQVTIQLGTWRGNSTPHTAEFYLNGVQQTNPLQQKTANGPYTTTEVTEFRIDITNPFWSVLKKIDIVGTPQTISFDAGEGSGEMDDIETISGESYTLPTCTFTAPAGAEFEGWLCSFDEIIYPEEAAYLMPNVNVTFTAQWTTTCSAPTIKTQPTSELISKALGEAVSFGLVSDNADTYQWFLCNSEGGDRTVIDGATSATYEFNADKVGTYYYICEVKKNDCDKITSSTVVSTSIAPVKFTIQYTTGVSNSTTYTKDNITEAKTTTQATYITDLSNWTCSGTMATLAQAKGTGSMSPAFTATKANNRGADDYLEYSFNVLSGNYLAIDNVTMSVQASNGQTKIQYEIIDESGHSFTSTATSTGSTSAVVNMPSTCDKTIKFVGKVYFRVYAWYSGTATNFRIGNSTSVTGQIYSLPELADFAWTTAPADGTVGDAAATILAKSATYPDATGITYSSNNTSVATIDNNKLHYEAGGEAYISATIQGDGVNYSTTTISQKITVIVPTTITTFTNKEGDGLWSTKDNWSDGIPDNTMQAIIAAPCSIPSIPTGVHAVAKSIKIDQDKSASIDIASTASLQVEGTIKRADGNPTEVSDIYIHSDEHGTGALIFDNSDEENLAKATVEYYSIASGAPDNCQWQWMTTPFNHVDDVQNHYYGAWMYERNNETKQWDDIVNGSTMDAFKAYTLSQKTKGTTYYMQGELVSTDEHSIKVTFKGKRPYLFGNSWVAPINIAQMSDDAFYNLDKTIVMFNTGLNTTGQRDPSVADLNETSGQYISIPVEQAASLDKKYQVIPAMAAFQVKAISSASEAYDKSGKASLTLSYDMVRTTGDVNIQPLHSPARRANAEGLLNGNTAKMIIKVQSADYFADELYLFRNPSCTEGYDNGWDGEKVLGESYAPQLFVTTTAGKWAVSTQDVIEGTIISFRAGSAQSYTLSFDYIGDEDWYLFDSENYTYTPINNMSTYTFYSGATTATDRFLITSYSGQDMPTGSDKVSADEDGAKKVILNEKLFIIHQHRLFDGQGKLVK